MVLFCGSILYTSSFGTISLLLFLKIQILCTAVAAGIALLFIVKKKLITVAEKENLHAVIRQVLPFALIVLLMSLHYRLDGFLLERIHSNGALEAGIYASAYRLLDASNMVGYLASSFLVAFIARHLSEKEFLKDAIFNTRHVLLFCSIGVVAFVVVFAPWLQQLLYHSKDPYHTLVMQLCIAAFPGYCLVHVYGSALTGAARLRQFIGILILSVALNTILNLAFIPTYGAKGCCIAALISQYFCGLTTLVVATKTLDVPYHGKSIFVYLLTAVLLVTFFWFGRYAVINVWIVLGVAFCFSLFLLLTQLSFFKKSFISPR